VTHLGLVGRKLGMDYGDSPEKVSYYSKETLLVRSNPIKRFEIKINQLYACSQQILKIDYKLESSTGKNNYLCKIVQVLKDRRLS
jgi:hypothetical protein